MSTLEEVGSAALSVPFGQRFHLVDALYESMGSPLGGEQHLLSRRPFEAEMDRRLEAYLFGKEPGRPWEDLQKEAHAILREP